MFLKNIKLTNFRNHGNYETDFNSGVTIIIGPNAVGKTNILESIYMISTVRSFKAKYDRDVIRHEQDFARIEGRVEDENDEKSLELFIQKNQDFENASVKKAKINKVPKSLHSFIGNLNAVLFSPEDIDVLTGSPSARRKYLDNVLYQISPEYKKTHSEYILAIRQRNKVLEKIRERGHGMDELGFWNTKIVQTGQIIQSDRKKMIDFLSKRLASYGVDLNNPETIFALKYVKNEISFERLHEYQGRELATKSTLVGPHRDDFEIYLNKFNLAEFGSRGQQRSAILALKMAEIDYFVGETGKRPILLLDDVFSELDEKHEEALLNTVTLQQTIITTTDIQRARESGYELKGLS